MPNIGPMELALVLGVAILIFGGKKIPELGRGLGEGIKNFKNALRSASDDEVKPDLKKPS